jgi:hypothetical protein
MTNPSSDPRTDRITLLLGTLAAVVSGWGWYSLMVHEAHAPAWIAALGIAAFELFVVGLARTSVRTALDGDSPAPYTAGIVAVAVLAMALQFAAAITEGWGWVVGVVLAMAPAAAITLWVAHIRRLFRLRGRVNGTVAQPPATVEVSIWLRNFRAAWAAKSLAVLDRTLSPKDAVILGLQATRPVPRREIEPPARVDRGLRFEDVMPELVSGQAPDVSGQSNGMSGHPVESVHVMVPAQGQVAQTVRDLIADGTDRETAVSRIVEQWPGVNRDSVRRAYDRAST